MATPDLEQYRDLDAQIESLLQCKPLPEADVKALCAKAQEIFVDENNVQPVKAPVTVSTRKRGATLIFSKISASPSHCQCDGTAFHL